jgi:hypothetical protein
MASGWFVVNAAEAMPPTSHSMPNFFVVGAPKAGTTSLYHYLDQHPDICMSLIKEPNYFAAEIRQENFTEVLPETEADQRALKEYLRGPMTEKRFGGLVTDWDDYLKLFRNAKDERAIGEASVCYLWSKTAADNIHAKIPAARIIAILRDPVDRAFSQYLQSVTGGRTRSSFPAYVETCLRHRDGELDEFRFCLELGLYCDGVQRFLDRFPRKNVHIVFYEDYQKQQSQILAAMFDFLGVDPTFLPDTGERHHRFQAPRSLAASYFLKKSGMWKLGGKLSPPGLRPFLRGLTLRRRGHVAVGQRERARLLEYYRDDIRKLEALLVRDLGAWLR